MGEAIILRFISLFVQVFSILILIRVLMSWVPSLAENSFGRMIHDITEPVLAPVRKILPQGQMIDLSPLVAYFLLQGLQILAFNLLGSA